MKSVNKYTVNVAAKRQGSTIWTIAKRWNKLPFNLCLYFLCFISIICSGDTVDESVLVVAWNVALSLDEILWKEWIKTFRNQAPKLKLDKHLLLQTPLIWGMLLPRQPAHSVSVQTMLAVLNRDTIHLMHSWFSAKGIHVWCTPPDHVFVLH